MAHHIAAAVLESLAPAVRSVLIPQLKWSIVIRPLPIISDGTDNFGSDNFSYLEDGHSWWR